MRQALFVLCCVVEWVEWGEGRGHECAHVYVWAGVVIHEKQQHMQVADLYSTYLWQGAPCLGL